MFTTDNYMLVPIKIISNLFINFLKIFKTELYKFVYIYLNIYFSPKC